MKLTKEDIKHIAKLARINLTDEEVGRFTEQFDNILGFVEKLNEVNVDGVPETSQVNGMSNVSRPDVVDQFPDGEKLIACSRNPIENNQIRAPKSI